MCVSRGVFYNELQEADGAGAGSDQPGRKVNNEDHRYVVCSVIQTIVYVMHHVFSQPSPFIDLHFTHDEMLTLTFPTLLISTACRETVRKAWQGPLSEGSERCKWLRRVTSNSNQLCND